MSIKRPDAIDKAVGHAIRVYRLNRGMSQTDLADKLGVTFQQVQKYEKGVNRVGAGRLTKIAEVLGVGTEVLLHSNDPTHQGDPTSSLTALVRDKRALRLMQAFDQIDDPNLREAIASMVEAMAGSHDTAHRQAA